ncbi:MAG: EpsI family protein [candidate division Zixibacteria bacterium]|nr:EpsI family protein [candidate division Zixibacteria bacterium]
MDFRKKSYWVLIAATIAVGIFTLLLRYQTVTADKMADFSDMPLQIGQWEGIEKYFDESVYAILNTDVSTYRIYTGPAGENIAIFIAYFKDQKYGSQIHSPKNCLPGGGWEIRDAENFRYTAEDGEVIDANLFWITKAGTNPQLMIYWFVTRGGVIADEYGLKLDLVSNSIQRKPSDASFIRITTRLIGNQSREEAVEMVSEFLDLLYPHIKKSLPFYE